MSHKNRTNSFTLFFKALGNTKHEMWVSLQVLVVITIVLSIILYIVEHIAQPDVYNSIWDSVLWSFMQYIGDPGDFADFKPITVAGRIIAAIIGIIGIAIFAVPAGLIGSGFMDAIAEDRKIRELEDASVVLHKRFRRTAQPASWFINEEGLKTSYKFVDRYQSIAYLQIKTGMSSEKLMETVNYCPDFRLANMASTQSGKAQNERYDRLVVVNFPLNTEYGCFLDRGSNVTIVVPASLTQMAIGNAAFSLAAMGGFNYVSRELSPSPEDTFGFYTMNKDSLDLIGDYDKKEDIESQALHFMDDLARLKKNSAERGERHWFIFLLTTTKTKDCQVHFWRLATDKKKERGNRIETATHEYGSTVLLEDEEKLQCIFQEVQQALSKRKVTVRDKEQSIVTGIDNCDLWKGLNKSNIICRLKGGIDCNALSIRFGYEVVLASNSHLLVMKDIADVVKRNIEPNREIPEEAKQCFLKSGDGFADNYGEEKIFMRSPQELKDMISHFSKEVRDRFEKYDIDGNIQDNFK